VTGPWVSATRGLARLCKLRRVKPLDLLDEASKSAPRIPPGSNDVGIGAWLSSVESQSLGSVLHPELLSHAAGSASAPSLAQGKHYSMKAVCTGKTLYYDNGYITIYFVLQSYTP
jgi:hypothetical protein